MVNGGILIGIYQAFGYTAYNNTFKIERLKKACLNANIKDLKNNYELVNNITSQIQKIIDEKAEIKLRPQKAPFPEERIIQIINGVSDVTATWDTIQRRLDKPVCTATESFYDDYVQENAKFRHNSGFKCYITRTVSGKCCKWCSEVAGRYEYSETPHDVYRRHDNCHCSVIFENGRTRQDVWTKKTWQDKNFSRKKYKPKKLSQNQAKNLQQENLNYKNLKNNLTSVQNNDNINLVNNYHSGIFDNLKNKLKSIFTNKSYLPVAEEYFNDLPQKTSIYNSYEDMKATNPHYNDSYNYQINCQRCVPAYEMRRRGYNVIAKPAPNNDILGFIFEKIFVDMKWQTCPNGSGIDDIKEYMKKCGDGSRAEISLQTYEGAHLFMAEQHNGITYFIDPQNYKADAKKHFEKVLIAPTRVCRIDNLKFSELIRECCEKVIE